MRFTALALTLLGLGVLAAPGSTVAADGPVIWKTSLRINVARYSRYFPTPTAKEPVYLTTSWYPRFAFTVQGPLAAGSQLSVTFTKPGGAAWVTIPVETPELPAGETRLIEYPNDTEKERQAIIATGLCSFSINLKNALTGSEATLYKGTFTVSKFHFGDADPKNKNQFEYFVEHDWQLPIGYLYVDPNPKEEAPKLTVAMWFRGEVKHANTEAYLFYKGKQIGSTQAGDASLMESATIQTPGLLPDPRWDRCSVTFHRVAATNRMTSANNYGPDWTFLDKNPGEYELKVTRNGMLARTATFTVGADGKIVDNGLAAKNTLGTPWMLLPLKVLPGVDGKANPANFQTEAYYGNGITGFPKP